MSIPTFIQVVLIALKLIGVIHWSWLWVLSPTWLGFGIVFLITVISAGRESAAEMKNPTRSVDFSNTPLARYTNPHMDDADDLGFYDDDDEDDWEIVDDDERKTG